MRHLFVDPAILSGESVSITGPNAHHLVNVLRIRVGEELALLDGLGGAVIVQIVVVEKRHVEARVLGPAEVAPEPPIHATVAQALGKGDRFEQVIRHGTEAGASAFIPLSTERTIVLLTSAEGNGKLERWRMVAKGAAEQSGRARIPEICEVEPLFRLLGRVPRLGPVGLLHPEGERFGEWATEAQEYGSAVILVGPEGGFSAREVEQAQGAGARIISLGPYVLRTETAAVAALSRLVGPTFEVDAL